MIFVSIIKRFWVVILIAVLVIAGVVIFNIYKRNVIREQTVIIVLSPHADDAEMSLGGFLKENRHPEVILPIFVGDERGLTRQEIAKDIQALIASYSGKNVEVYGPAAFPEAIADPQHMLVHEAFIDVAGLYPEAPVRFFIYEDRPYIEAFNKTSLHSLERYIEDMDGIFLTAHKLPVSGETVYEISRL